MCVIYTNNKGFDQTAHVCSLVKAFAVRRLCMDTEELTATKTVLDRLTFLPSVSCLQILVSHFFFNDLA